MGGAAPRFLFLLPLLRHNLRLLSPSFSSHFHRRLFSSSSSLSSLSPSLTPKLKASQHQQQQQQQQLHTQPSSSLPGTHPWPECSRFLAHISSAGYAFTPPTAATGELSQSEANACLAFARDRPNLLRLLSMRDVAVVVEHGTPFLFPDAEAIRKMKSFVSNGDSTASDADKANMVDLMKYMLSYASVSSERNNFYNRDLVESSIRNLFGELFKLSYNAPGPNSFDSVQNQMPGRFGQAMPPGQNIEMKRGDWICPRCNFMNFARNTKCLECEEARPKRQLAGGEWECPQCDFHNYGRNVACLRCDCKRPGQISLGATNTMSQTAYGSGNNFGATNTMSQTAYGSGNTFGATNTMSQTAYGSGNNSNSSDVDARLAANEEKAQRWFNKVSQLDSNADINSVIADEDFPEIMPLRKGVNRFVVSTRKTPLERRLANAQYKRNLGNNGTSGVEDYRAGELTESHDTLDDMLSRSTGFPQSDNKNIVTQQNTNRESPPSFGTSTSHFKDVKGSNTSTLPPFPLSAHTPSQNSDVRYAGSSDSPQFSNNSTSENVVIKDEEDKEQAEKSERWFRKVAELNDVPDITSAISDDDFPEIMPMRKGENRFVVSKKKDRSLTTPAYKRRQAMEQSGNNNFVPFVPFPPDYFAKKDKQHTDGTDSTDNSNVQSSSVSEVAEMSSYNRARPEQNSNNNNNVDSTYGATSSGNSSQSFNQDHVPNSTLIPSSGSATENRNVKTEWTGKSLEGSAVREPDPLDMSEEAKAERWFRRVAQIKDISELSQIPDEDFPSIMPMRKGVNRFVVSKRKTPLERRLTSQQYRKNLPTVSSDPVKRENEGS